MPSHVSPSPPHLDPALRLFRRVMPGIHGVVLASETDGRPLAHDLPIDPAPVARQGRLQHLAFSGSPGASTFVAHDASLYLVVFVPHAGAEGFSTDAPLPASCPAQTETWSPAATP